MEEAKKPNMKLILIIAIFSLLVLFSLVLYMFYLVSIVATIWGSLLLFILIIYCIARLVIRLSVFPGSFWLWKRSIESHFCREMSLQLLQKVRELQISLDLLLDKCEESEKIEFIDRSIESTTTAKRMISSIIDSYTIEKHHKTLTSYGESLLLLLLNFQQIMKNCKILIDNNESNMWDFIDEAVEGKQWADVVSEEYPSNTTGWQALEICNELQKRLLESCGEASLYQKINRFLFDSTLGTIDQMRNELESRFSCEQVFLNVNGVDLDCMMVYGSDNIDVPTIVLCNPNAGLYEFSYYQSEWLEYYLSGGLNVFLWNYRGYGRSKGSPSPSALKKDALSIINYLQTEKLIKVLGVHGESLGGAVATYVARYCEIDFLFVDRSFSKLNELVQYNFGKWGRYILYIVSHWSLDTAQDYLYVNCYKIMSSDPNDHMINDLASLKSGVAVKLIETRGLEIVEGISPAQLDLKKYCHILNGNDTMNMAQAVNCLMDFVIKYIKNDLDRGFTDLTGASQFQSVEKEHDGIEETVNALLFRVFNILDSFDAGGKLLSGISIENDGMLSIKLWIMVLDIWGCFLPMDPSDINSTRIRALERLEYYINELRIIFADHEYSVNSTVIEINKYCKVLEKCLAKIMVYLKNQLPTNRLSDGELSGREELGTLRHHYEYDKAGYLLPLSCGHSGRYSISELEVLETHLMRIGFIK